MSEKFLGMNPIVGNKKDAFEIISSLWQKLPTIAKDLILQTQDISEPRNKIFFDNPDNYLEHEPNWHQWGIITHTKMFEKFYHQEIPAYIEDWGIKEKVDSYMSEEIDGMNKEVLLNMSIPLHDLGKFTMRRLKKEEDGSISTSFKKHEVESGRIIRSIKFSEMLKKEYNVTAAQIEYIARCAELHYELGIVRDEAKKSKMGYTLIYAQSDEFAERAKQLQEQHTGFGLEVGILFLADSLAKTDIRLNNDTDKDLSAQEQKTKELIVQRGLNPKLIKAVMQLPVNREIAKTYLSICCNKQ